MLKPYLKSGTPAICLITPEPDRGEKIIQCEEWDFFTWDCLLGIRKQEQIKSSTKSQIPLRRLTS